MKAAAILATATALFAHTGEPLQPHDLWTAWPAEPGILLSLGLAIVLYGVGSRTSRGVSLKQMVYFWGGMAAVTLALASPLHPMGEVLFSAHMLQHEVLMLIAAPLLVLSRPVPSLLWGMPFAARRAVGRWSKPAAVQSAWRWMTRPLSAWCLHAAALWAWHAPGLFQATLRSEWVHTAQHLSFFGTALLFWWSLFEARDLGQGVLSTFTTAIHTGILGALLTFSPAVIYPAYASTAPLWGMTALEDQQIGGLIMWVPAGLVYLAAGLGMFWLWMRKAGVAMACLLLIGCGGRPAPVNRGAAAIGKYGCGSCHTISGIPGAHGLVGPPLTGLRNRMYVAGRLPNTPENLSEWIQKPKEISPGTAMPQLGVSPREAGDIASYIYAMQ